MLPRRNVTVQYYEILCNQATPLFRYLFRLSLVFFSDSAIFRIMQRTGGNISALSAVGLSGLHTLPAAVCHLMRLCFFTVSMTFFPVFLLAFALFLCLPMSPLSAVPDVSALSIRIGSSHKIRHHSWATFSCLLKNPDKTTEDMEMRLIDKLHGAYQQNTLCTDIVTIPPETSIYYSAPVLIENAEEYYIEKFIDGRRTGKTDSALFSLVTGRASPLPVFNDSLSVNFGSFAGMPEMENRFKMTYFSSRQQLRKWGLLERADFAVIVAPDFSKYPAAEFQAIIDFVKQGGTLLFTDPAGIKAAIETPLAPLLPFLPMKTRKIQQLPELRTLSPGFKSFAYPVDFLECIPSGNGISLLKLGEFPLVRWKKFGLGSVRAATFPLGSDCFSSQEDWNNLMRLFFSDLQLKDDTSKVNEALDEMTGFTIPPLSSVRLTVLIYLLLLAVPVLLGLFLKKTVYAWWTAAALSIVFASFIIFSASGSSRKKKGIFLSFVEIIVPGNDSAPTRGFYSLMSSNDSVATITPSAATDVLLSAIPPSESNLIFIMQGNQKAPALEIVSKNGRQGIPALNLPVNTPRQFHALFSSAAAQHPLKYKHPVIHYTEKGIVFDTWTIPGNLHPDTAWLQLPAGSIPLSVGKNTLTMKASGRAAFKPDTIQQIVREFSVNGVKKTSPVLVLSEDREESLLISHSDFLSHGKRLVFLPVTESIDKENILIPGEMISFVPGDPSVRLIMSGNRLKPSLFARTSASFLFRFHLPAYFSNIRPEKLALNFSYVNDSRNVIIKPFLLGREVVVKEIIPPRKRRPSHRKQGRKKKGKTKTGTQPAKKTAVVKKQAAPRYREVRRREKIYGIPDGKGRFVFDVVDNPLNPCSGTGIIGLEITLKEDNLSLSEREKANTWRPVKFSLQLEGSLPDFDGQIVY